MMNKLAKIFRFPHVLWWLPFAAMVIFFYPVLFGSKLAFGVAHSTAEDLPMYYWFGEALRAGSWHINSLYFGGVASYLSQFAMLHPIMLLFYNFLKPISAYYWVIALSFVGQWYGFYLLSRKLKISMVSAAFASFVWIFSQWNIQWGGLEAIGLFLVWVPLLFFLIIKISEEKHKFWYALLAALILAPNWVFGLTQTTLYLAAALGIFAMFLDFKKHRFLFLKYKNTFICIAIILLSVAIVLPVLKADYSIYSLSWRSGGLSYQDSFNKDYFNVFDLVHFVSPFIILPFINTEYTHFYLGILPLLFIALTWRMREENVFIEFFQWMMIVTLATAIIYSPIFYILTKIPVFNSFRGPGKFLFLTTFAMAILAGFGLDTLRENQGLKFFSRISSFYKKFLVIFGLIIVAINAAYYFAFEFLVKIGFKVFMRFGYVRTLQREPVYYVDKVRELLSSWFYQFSFSNIEIWLAIITLISTGLIVLLFLKNKVSFAVFSILAILLVYSSSFFIWHRYYNFVSASLLNPPPVIQFLIDHRDDQYRALSFNIGIESYKKMGLDNKNPEKSFKFDIAILRTDEFMYYNIETLNGHESLLTKRQEFFSDFNSQFMTQKLTLNEKRKLFESRAELLSMMNVKYVLSSLPLGEPFIKRLDSVITDTQIPLYIYENLNVLPRIYLAESVEHMKENLPNDAIIQKISEVNDFKKKTLIECDGCKEASVSKRGIVDLKSYKPDEIVLGVQNKNESWLVLSNSFLPGWRAFIDDQEVKIYRANYLFQAIKIPSGDYKILFKYKIL